MSDIHGFASRQGIHIPRLEPLTSRNLLSKSFNSGNIEGSIAEFNQLVQSPDKRVSVVFSGTIYNLREIKNELNGYAFKSAGDPEIIIAAYLKWGIDCVYRFNGMFALALFDKEVEVFYLIRDQIGIKPLYYQFEGDDICFASNLKVFMKQPGFKKEIRKDVLSRYLFHQYICHPDSIFAGIFKLPPGAILQMDFRGKSPAPEVKKYWDVATVYHEMQESPVDDYHQARSELKDLLKKAVSARMIADAPVGAFLSGGFDSSLICAIAAEATDTPLKTFSIGFHEDSHNEAKYAKAVADFLGTNHTEAYISEDEMFALVESIPQYYDEPFADASQIPTMMASELASHDVRIALSGDGGDEFYCGYNIYEAIRQAQILDIPGAILHGLVNLPLLGKLNLEKRLPFRVRVITANRHPETKVQFGGAGSYAPMARKMVETDSALHINYPFESKYQVKNWQIRRMLLDMETYLPADCCVKVDRAAARYSLENRSPIIDRDVMEYSFRLNHSFKYHNGVKKRILKDIAYDYIPRELLDRPKVGFGVPLDKWLRGPLRDQLTDMVNEGFLRQQGIFNAIYTAETINKYLLTGDGGPATGANYSKLIWSFFVFQKWYEHYMK